MAFDSVQGGSLIDHHQLKTVMAEMHSEEGNSHDVFMSSYHSMFLPSCRPKAGIPDRPTKSYLQSHPNLGQKPRSRHGLRKSGPSSIYTDPFSKHEDAETVISSASTTSKDQIRHEKLVGELHQIIAKLPFERSQKEHKRAYELFTELVPVELLACIEDPHQKDILRHIIRASTLLSYPDTGITVFGKSGLFMVLKGMVRPQTVPYLNINTPLPDDNPDLTRMQTPILKRRHIKLGPGDCFGTYQTIPGKSSNSKIFSVTTAEPCEFLKISTHDFDRITSKMQENEQSRRMFVIQACKTYENWPNLSVKALASCIEWQHYLSNTVILAEGEICPFMVFIKSGRCEILKSVDAIKTISSNQKIKMRRQVCMGTLDAGDSVGETSMLMQEILPCSVIARTNIVMGVIKEERMKELDDTTRTLLVQSVKPMFPDLTEDAIQQKFIAQEMKSDWEKLKHKVLLQTVNYCGIRPGYGKWSH